MSILSSVPVTGLDHETGLYKIWLQFRDKTHNPNPKYLNFLFQFCPRIVSYCNGLVCATCDNTEAIICNPTTGEVCKFSLFCLPELGTRNTTEFLVFAFQDIENKLLRVVCSWTVWKGYVVHAKLYAMRTNTCTKIEVKIEDTDHILSSLSNGDFSDPSPVVVKNVFYWKASKSGTRMTPFPCVVSFDMNRFVFRMIDIPKGIIRDTKHWLPVDLKGTLALATTPKKRWIEMWVLNIEKRSWTMEFSVQLDLPCISRNIRVLGCERNGNLLMQRDSAGLERKLFSYDRDRDKVTHLPFAGLKQNHKVCFYKESLLYI